MKQKLENHILKGRRIRHIENNLVYGIDDVYEFGLDSIKYITLLTYRVHPNDSNKKSHGQVDWKITENPEDISNVITDIIEMNNERYELIDVNDEINFPISTY